MISIEGHVSLVFQFRNFVLLVGRSSASTPPHLSGECALVATSEARKVEIPMIHTQHDRQYRAKSPITTFSFCACMSHVPYPLPYSSRLNYIIRVLVVVSFHSNKKFMSTFLTQCMAASFLLVSYASCIARHRVFVTLTIL